MPKKTFYIFLFLIVSSCNLDFGEQKDFDKNSEEALQRIKAHLMLQDQEGVSQWNYFMDETGIDNYYVATFKTNPEIIDKVILRLNMNIDSTDNYIYITEESPSWFSPPIDKKNEFPTYISDGPGKKQLIYYNKNDSTCYYAYFS